MHFRLLPIGVCASIVTFRFFAVATACAAESFAFRDQAGEYLEVRHGDKIVARYMYAFDYSTAERREETYKPYLHVFDAEGAMPITKGAGGSFTHHRGIFIGWNKLTLQGKRYDRWHMRGGEQIHEKFLARKTDESRADFTSLVRWTGETRNDALVKEERTFSFLQPPPAAYALIETKSKISAVAGEMMLDGDPEHAGLHFRAADNIDRKQTRFFFSKEGADPRKDRDYPWFGATFVVNGKRSTVIYFNHPANPSGAVSSAYRDYGRFGNFWRVAVPAGETREFRARFLVVSGEPPATDLLEKLSREFASSE